MANTFSVSRSICVLTEPVVYLVLLFALFALQLKAQTTSSWNGGTGNWSVTSDWSPAGVPNNIGTTTFNVNIVAPNSVVSMDILNATIDNLTLASANSLTINSGNSLTLISGTSANYGTIANNGGFLLGENFNPSSPTFNNYSTIINANEFGNEIGLSTINNYGTISGPGGLINSPGGTFNNYGTSFSGNFSNFGIATNYGTLSISGQSGNQGTLTDYGTLSNAGTLISVTGSAQITVAATGTLYNTGTLQNESLFTNAGTIYNAPGALITNADLLSGHIENTGTIINAGSIINYIIWQGSGTIANLSGGSLTNYFNLSVNTLNNAGTVTNNGTFSPNNFSAGTITNSGNITNEGASALFSAGTIISSGKINNTLGATFGAGTFINTGVVNNQGTMDSGSFTNFGRVRISDTGVFNSSTNYNQFSGSTLVNGTLTASNGAIVNSLGGSLSGGGTVNGNVVMGGNIIAGTHGNPLTFNINGNYTQNATGVFTELIGSKGNGLLNISGTAALAPGASLNVQLVGGFDPKNGTSFTIMDYGSEQGTFTISDPYFDNGKQEWVTSYAGGAGNDVVLTAEASNVVTPEPCTVLLVGTVLLGMGGYAKKKRASEAQ